MKKYIFGLFFLATSNLLSSDTNSNIPNQITYTTRLPIFSNIPILGYGVRYLFDRTTTLTDPTEIQNYLDEEKRFKNRSAGETFKDSAPFVLGIGSLIVIYGYEFMQRISDLKR